MWLVAAVLLLDFVQWTFGDVRLFWGVVIQTLPFPPLVVLWVHLARGAKSHRLHEALVYASAWFILLATVAAAGIFAQQERRPAEGRIHDQLAAYSNVLPIFLLVFAIEWLRGRDARGKSTLQMSHSRILVGVWSASLIGITELATLTALGEERPSPEWVSLAAAAVVTGIVGAILLPALDLLESRAVGIEGSGDDLRPPD